MTVCPSRATLDAMALRIWLSASVAVICVAGFGACDDVGDDGDSTDATGEDPNELCGDPAGYDEFSVGLAKTGEQMTVTFVDAQPAPPIRDFNTWTLMVTGADGEPLSVMAWEVFPWMPDHGHGSPTPTVVEEGEEDGQYVLDPVNLFMAGKWTIDLTATLPDEQGTDTVQFAFCVR